jgi:hypothetical protein
MLQPTIRPARSDEHDVVAQVWMESWVSTGLEDASNFLLAKLRARIPMEIGKGWSLFVADDGGAIAAMLALHLRERYSTSSSSRQIPGQRHRAEIARFTRTQLPDDLAALRARE